MEPILHNAVDAIFVIVAGIRARRQACRSAGNNCSGAAACPPRELGCIILHRCLSRKKPLPLHFLALLVQQEALVVAL